MNNEYTLYMYAKNFAFIGVSVVVGGGGGGGGV
jgi:hypothetical protein